jgi:two-component system, NarL family, sensor histidine kinase DegS
MIMSEAQNTKKSEWRNGQKLASNPHLWAIIIIMAFLSLFYYQTFIFGDRLLAFSWYLAIWEFNYNIIGILFYVPVIYAAFIFRWFGSLITWLISMCIILPQILTFRNDIESHVTNILYLLIPLIVVIYISLELNWREKERKGQAEREAERQNYISQVFKAQEDERKRISQEIHDDSIQRLAGVASLAQMLAHDKNLTDYPVLQQRADSIKENIILISQDLRRLSVDLRPTVLDDLGLIPALYWLVDRFKQDTGIASSLEITGENRPLTTKITVLIFRIVQEALNNAKRHSQATSVNVRLQISPQTIRVVIGDNGKGFSVPQIFNYYQLTNKGKLGLIGMQQRTQVLGGRFDIQSEPGNGTTISVEVGF